MNTTAHHYYETLNIKPSATAIEIVSAYREAKLIFHPDSLAANAIYSQDELKTLILDIEQAYTILANSDTRSVYDKTLDLPSQQAEPTSSQPLQAERSCKTPHQHNPLPKQLSGEQLKTIRISLNIQLDDIAEQTKISKIYLKAIEAEDTSKFPEPIYIKSYLKQYAQTLGLDPQEVLTAYQAYTS